MPKAPNLHEDDSKPDKIPRPPNAWIIYRGDRLTEWKAARSPNDPPVKQADISRLIARRWREEDDNVKLQYEKRAAIAKAEHKRRYPDYKYNPVSKEAKEKMRAEEKEAKKKAREEAKAAKSAPRPSLRHSREPSHSSPPSGSNVKLESMDSPSADQTDAETDADDGPRVVDPIDRGCGPSPPIDYDPQSPSSFSISSSSASSSTSFESVRSSPLPTPSQPSPAPADASQAWQHPSPSPLSSSPTQPPPPAYPSAFVHSPVPSRQASYNLLSSSSSSTSSESPPSYSDGENWQPGPPDSAFAPFTPLPGFQSNWNTPAQDPLLLPQGVSDVNFSLFDPSLSHPQPDQFNVGSASVGAIFDLSGSAPQMGSANSPPGELELDISAFAQHFPTVGEQPALRPAADELVPVLDMAELHETMEDRAAEVGLPTPGVAEGFSLESFAAFVNSHPTDALALADPDFYAILGRRIMERFPAIAVSLLPQTMGVAPPQYMANANVFSADGFVPIQQQPQQQQQLPQDQAFDASMYQIFMQQPELAMPAPMHAIPVADMSAHSTPIQTEPSYTYAAAPLVQHTLTPLATAPAPMPVPAPAAEAAPPRYVPPGGAGMIGRRRVARTYNVPRMSHPSDSE